MNENLDLRNRILKMRESNDLVVTKTNSLNNNLMSKFENTIKEDKPKKNFLSKNIEKEKNEESIEKPIINNSENLVYPNNKSAKGMFNDNEAKFLLLANKFNEAVEVILELSQKVEKLENLYQNLNQTKKLKSKTSFFNLKGFTFLLIIILTMVGFFTLPIDFSLIKLIIVDVFSMI